MKIKNLLWMAAAAITLASCSNEEEVVNAGNKDGMKQLILIAENPDLENDSRTAIGEENGKIVPMWEAGDYLSNIINDSYTIACMMEEPLPEGSSCKKAKFKLIYDDSVYGIDSFLIAYLGDNNNKDRIDLMMSRTSVDSYEQVYNRTFADRKSIYKNDLLVSDLIPVNDETFGKPYELKLKRLSSVVRMKINDKTENNLLKDDEITKVALYGMNGAILLSDSQKSYTFYTTENPYDVLMDKIIYKPGDGSFVFSCMPKTFKTGEEFKITVQTKNLFIFEKKITADEAGILFESGKITNLTLNLKDSEIIQYGTIDPTPDANLDPTIEGNVITMKPGHPGRMTSDMIIKAVGTGKSFKVVGDINAFDINSILKISKGKIKSDLQGIKADLSDANIKADDKASYEITVTENMHEVVKLHKINKDNTATRKSFMLNSIISELILPNSLTDIDIYAIDCDMGTKLTIGTGILSLGMNSINIDSTTGTENVTIKILAKPIRAMNFEWGFCYGSDKCNLILNKEWDDPNRKWYKIEGNKWMSNVPWAGISFCDDNGNPIL